MVVGTTDKALWEKAYELEKSSEEKDSKVHHPSYYNEGEIECIDAVEAAIKNKTGLEAFCTANIIKYLWRYEGKGGREDVQKAQWYLTKLLTILNDKK